MKNYKHLYLVLIGLCVLGACHKYKYDEHRTLDSPQDRLIGTWHLVEYRVNEVDSTDEYYANNLFACDIKVQYNNSDHFIATTCWHSPYTMDGSKFGFRSNKKMAIENWIIYPIDTFPNYTVFNIDKLYKTDWWLSLNKNGNSYIIKFKKIA